MIGAAAERAFVAACTWVVDDVGTQQTFLLGTRGFATGPADTPPNTVVRELLFDPGSYQNELFSGARVTGVVRPSFGGLVFSNEGGVLDDWAGYGISGGPVELYDGVVGTPFPAAWTKVFKAYGNGLSASVPDERTGVGAAIDVDRVTVSLQSRDTLLDTSVATEVYGPGDTYVAGTLTKKKPFVLGMPGFSPLVLLDPVLLIYSFQTTAADSRFLFGTGAPLYVPHDGGVPYTYEGYYATAADGLDAAQSPAPGHYKVWAPNGTSQPTGFYGDSTGPCFIRLGSQPLNDLRIKPLGLYLGSQAEGARPWTFVDLCQHAGLSDVTSSTLAPGSYVKLAGNRYLAGNETYLQVMNDVANTTFTAFGFDRLDRFFCFDLQDPDADPAEPIAMVFTEHNSRNLRRIPVPGQERPVAQINGSAGLTYPGAVNGGASPAVQEEFTRDPWQDRWTVSSALVRAANPGAISVDVSFDGNEFTGGDAAKLAHGRRYIELFGGRREIFSLECTQFEAQSIGVEIGARVTIKRNRFGCDAGRQFRVVTRRINGKQRTITFGLWGGTAGPSDAKLGGGEAPRPFNDASGYFRTRLPNPRMRAYISVPGIAVVGFKSLPLPKMRCVIEGGSPLSGPAPAFDPDSWSPSGNPHWANQIFLGYFEGSDGALASVTTDSSAWNRGISAAALVLTDTAPIQGATSLDFDGSNSVQHAAYSGGTETIVGTQDWTFELVLNGNAIQSATAPILVQVTPQFGPAWQADNCALHLVHSPPYDVAVSFWAYNFSNTLPMLYGTTDLRGLGKSHIAVSRVANDWFLGIRGSIEDSTTWSGSINSVALRRFIGGSPNASGSCVEGLVDCVREHVGVGLYTADYVPPWSGAPDVLAPLANILDLRFNGADADTTTTDSSVYAWTVTLEGGAVIDTAQSYEGGSSLQLNGSGARAVVSPTDNRLQACQGAIKLAIRPTSLADCVLATQGSASTFSWRVRLSSAQIVFENRQPGFIQTLVGGSIANAAWSVVRFEFVGSTLFGRLDMYVSDILVGALPWLGASGRPNNLPLTIGADDGGGSGFTGHIDVFGMTSAGSLF